MFNTPISPYGPLQQYGTFPQVPIPQMSAQPQAVQLTKVSGLEGAKAYQMPPNSSVALFHESEDLLYVKSTDGAGFPTIRTFRFEPFEVEPAEAPRYVTVDEFERFKREVLNAKQSVRKADKSAE